MARAPSCPDRCAVALLIVDVINDLDFPGGEVLLREAEPMARRIAALAGRARAAGVPVVYVNDNFGRWRSDFKAIVEYTRTTRGGALAELLHPGPDDYFVLKPRHSGFFGSSLEVLLQDLKARRLVLTGVAGNMCVLFTANDAHMRGYRLVVPRDCVASCSQDLNEHALTLMQRSLGADTTASTDLDLRGLCEDDIGTQRPR